MISEKALEVIDAAILDKSKTFAEINNKIEELARKINALTWGYRDLLGSVLSRFMEVIPGATELKIVVSKSCEYDDQGGFYDSFSYELFLFDEAGNEIPLEDEEGGDLTEVIQDKLQEVLCSAFPGDIVSEDGTEFVFKKEEC